MAADTDKAKKIKLYKNGDEKFLGKQLVLNKRRIKTWDSLLTTVTGDLKSTVAIRDIRTPQHGTKVKSLDELQENNSYVACGNTRFRKLPYNELDRNTIPVIHHSPRPNIIEAEQHKPAEIRPVEHSRRYNNVSGRFRKVPTDVTTIFIYANGRDKENAHRLILGPATMKMNNWVGILNMITETAKLNGACKKLYTLDWEQITDVMHFKNGQYYVAVGSDRALQKKNYGQQRPEFHTSPKLNRRKQQDNLPRNRKSRASDNSNSTYQSNASKDTQQSTQQTRGFALGGGGPNRAPDRSPARRQPPPQQRRPAAKKDDVFHAKPTRHSRSPGRTVDYDKDEGGVFKAKGKNRETQGAQEVDDTRDTQVELPIDQVEAEEVKDEDISIQKTRRRSRSRSPSPQLRELTNNSFGGTRTPRRLTPVQRSPTPRQSRAEHTLTPYGKTPTPQPRPASTRSDERGSPMSRNREYGKPTQAETPDRRDSASNRRSPTPTPRSPTPTQRDQTPTPRDKTPTPRDRTPTPKGRTPTPKQRTPTPRDRTPTPEVDNTKEREAAATKIQAGYKGYKTRKWMKKRKEEREQEELRHKAATKIQARYKGYRVRKSRKERKRSPTPQEELRHKAATKIQARYKGYRVRKSRKERKHSPTPQAEEEAVAAETESNHDREDKQDEEPAGEPELSDKPEEQKDDQDAAPAVAPETSEQPEEQKDDQTEQDEAKSTQLEEENPPTEETQPTE